MTSRSGTTSSAAWEKYNLFKFCILKMCDFLSIFGIGFYGSHIKA